MISGRIGHVLALLVTVGLVPTARAAVEPARFSSDGVVPEHARYIGEHLVAAIDLDRDGRPEVVLAQDEMWFVLGHDPIRNGYRILHVDEEVYVDGATENPRIDHARVVDLDEDGSQELVIRRASGHVDVLDPRTRELKSRFLPEFPRSRAMAVGRFQPGEGWQLILKDAEQVALFSFGDPVARWRNDQDFDPSSPMEAGQLDGDAAWEFILQLRSGDLLVFDGEDATIQAQLEGVRAISVVVADLAGDGVGELVFVRYSPIDSVQAFDVVADRLLWSIDMTVAHASPLLAVDLDGDTTQELIVSPTQWGDFFELDGNGAILSTYHYTQERVLGMAAGDFDGDCVLDVVASYRSNSTSNPAICVGKRGVAEEDWNLVQVTGPVASLVSADIDGDGHLELLSLAQDDTGASADQALVRITDLHAGLEKHLGRPAFSSYDEIHAVAAVQADIDPQLEYVTIDWETQRLTARDGLSHQVEWIADELPARDELFFLQTIDRDGDGQHELLVASARYDSFPFEQHWYLSYISPGDGSVISTSEDFLTDFKDLAIGELDGDTGLEILLTSFTGVTIVDAATLAEQSQLPLGSTMALAIGDHDGDGAMEIVAGRPDGTLLVADSATGMLRAVAGPFGEAVTALEFGDFDQNGSDELALVARESANHSRLHVLSWPDLSPLWVSKPLAGEAGRHRGLLVGDLDEDGQIEVAVGTKLSIQIFEYRIDEVDNLPPDLGSFSGVESALPVGDADCCPWVDLTWSPARDATHPPIAYRVHRGLTPDFAIDADSWLSDTIGTSHRDGDVLPETRYWYAVRAADSVGNSDDNETRLSALTPPPRAPEPATLVSVEDPDPCAATGLLLHFTHPVSPHELVFDLEVDGRVELQDIASPQAWLPSEEERNSYRVITRHRACPLAAASSQVWQVDRRPIDLQPARGLRLADPDRCRPGRARVRFSHRGFSWATGHHELWRDGVLLLADVVDGQEFDVPDAAAHEYAVRSFDDSCTQEVSTPTVPHADRSGCSDPIVRVSRLANPRLELEWESFPGISTHDAYQGSIDELWTTRSYDHESSRPALSFLSSPSPDNGCDATGGPLGLAIVDEGEALRSTYYLVVSVLEGGGEQEYGPNSAGLDRREAAVDPRDLSFACP